MPLPAPAAYPAIVIGGGISGLVCAYQLQQAGIPVRLLEAGSRPGGVIRTKQADGFLSDLGPQSFLTTEPLLALIDALGLKDQLLYADPRAPRYILVGGRLVPAPLSPPALMKSPLFSAGTKWRLFTEIARRTKPPAADESIAAFVRRKFGAELLDRLVSPFVSGVYAGDPEKLSLRAAFPKLHEFEQQYGSVLRGAMKSRPPKGTPRAGLCSFREGMETLPRAIAARLGDSLLLESSVTGLQRVTIAGKSLIEVSVLRHGQPEVLTGSAIVMATPTNVAAQLFAGFSGEWASLFSRIEYAPVAVISAGYRREQFQKPPDGFGFLVPREEKLHVLGTVFNTSLFPGRAPDGMIALTSFAGGATNPQFCELPGAEITATICAETATVLGISGEPAATELHVYPRAIPQYNLGHGETVAALAKLTAAAPELFLTGNYLSGPSIGACVDQATRTAQDVRVYLASIGVAGVGAVAHA